MCQRMDEHRESFEEGMEAVFWNDAKECVDQCRRLLNDDALVAAIKKTDTSDICKVNIITNLF